jgi:UDP-3-O-[3-hydroxymyristoyl] glucosamine N-acyltransferase
MINISPIVGLAGSKVMVSPVRQVTSGVAVGVRVVVAEGVNVGARVKVGASGRMAVGKGRLVA